MRLKLRVCAALTLAVLAIAADDPNALVEKAQQAQARREYAKAISLLEKADAAWESSSPNVQEHAEALDLMAVLMKAQAHAASENRNDMRYEVGLEQWRSEAAPLVKRAMEICEANCDAKPEDRALALELQADLLGRTNEGAPFWDRAMKIRAQRVAEMNAAPASPFVDPLSPLPGPPPERIGGDVSAPSVLSKREPEYTEAARLSHYSGTGLFSVIIDAQGVPTNIRLVRGLGYGLDEKGAQAISVWRFRPAMKNGTPVAVRANIEVNFRLL
jgi:TonB family protein